jgi:hypothetical protein
LGAQKKAPSIAAATDVTLIWSAIVSRSRISNRKTFGYTFRHPDAKTGDLD